MHNPAKDVVGHTTLSTRHRNDEWLTAVRRLQATRIRDATKIIYDSITLCRHRSVSYMWLCNNSRSAALFSRRVKENVRIWI